VAWLGLWHDRIASPSPRSPSPPRAWSTSPPTTSRRRCSGQGTPLYISLLVAGSLVNVLQHVVWKQRWLNLGLYMLISFISACCLFSCLTDLGMLFVFLFDWVEYKQIDQGLKGGEQLPPIYRMVMPYSICSQRMPNLFP